MTKEIKFEGLCSGGQNGKGIKYKIKKTSYQGFFLISAANLELQILYINVSQTLILESEPIQGETHEPWSKTT